MKVLFVNSVCGIRSTGRIVTDLADDFIEKGHECMMAYGRESVPEKYRSVSYRIGTQTDVKINALKARILDNEGFNAKKQTEKFIEWANNYNPDMLWLHNLHGYYINIEILFEWIKSRPDMQVRWTLHDCWPFTGHCAHFSYAKCDSWKTKCNNCSLTGEYPKSFFKDNSCGNFYRKKKAFCGVKDMTLITPSFWLADLVKESFLKDYSVEVKHNTINKSVFKPTSGDFRKDYNIMDKKIVLGVASAWSERKGINDFVKLSQILDGSYKVVLVGVDDTIRKKLPSEIVCVPSTNSARELAEIYTTANVFVNLTYEDNYPMVNLEAQACGTPCVTYRTGGSAESVPTQNVIEQGDINCLVRKIQQICMVK